jgi:hypothetical protein
MTLVVERLSAAPGSVGAPVVAGTAHAAFRAEQFRVARGRRRGGLDPTSFIGEIIEERNPREFEPTGIVGRAP